jgi:hypothetical protein
MGKAVEKKIVNVVAAMGTVSSYVLIRHRRQVTPPVAAGEATGWLQMEFGALTLMNAQKDLTDVHTAAATSLAPTPVPVGLGTS